MLRTVGVGGSGGGPAPNVGATVAALQAVMCIVRHCDCDGATVRESNRRGNRALGRMLGGSLGERLANVMPDGDI